MLRRKLLNESRFGRAASLAGLALFALTALLSPCINAIAAPVSDGVQDVTEALAITPVGIPNGRSDDGSGSSCHHFASALSWDANAVWGLATNCSPSGWVATEGMAAPFSTGLSPLRHFAKREAPSPPRRLYLRTLRLLI